MRKKNQNEDGKGKPGQKKGHKGLTRPYAKPDKQIDVTKDRCPDCGANLGSPFKIESKIIEEIPEPQSVTVTEYRIAHYICQRCQKVVTGTDAGCPDKANSVTIRLPRQLCLNIKIDCPHRKIQNALKRLYGLNISPATIFDLTRRAGRCGPIEL